jgi:hypothetical protein
VNRLIAACAFVLAVLVGFEIVLDHRERALRERESLILPTAAADAPAPAEVVELTVAMGDAAPPWHFVRVGGAWRSADYHGAFADAARGGARTTTGRSRTAPPWTA